MKSHEQRIEVAKQIISRLPEFSKFAAEDARLWTNYGKVRIYFDRQYIEINDDGEVVEGKGNPYGVLGFCGELELCS